LSDGTTTVGRSNDDAAAAAKAAGVPVTTIAFGTSTGTVELNGQSVDVPVDKPALAALASATGGQAFEAGSASALRAVYADIGHAIGFRTERREVSTWFIGVALAAAFAAAAGSLLWSSRLP
jgi:Ca-activated chloride channel family protein